MRRPVTTRDRVTALLLFLAAFVALGAAQRSQGVMRDEAYYFKAAEEQWAWFEQLGDDKQRGDMSNRYNIARYWSYNNEHPPLFKTLSGASWRLFHGYQPVGPGKDAVYHAQWKHPHEAISIMSEVSAFRLPAWFLTALCVAFIYLFGARLEGRLCGFSAALIYLTIPRVFFHGQLCAFDSPIVTLWLLTVYAYFRSLSRPSWALICGVLFGLALATKHNSWFIPPVLLLHYLMVVWPDVSLRPLSPPRVPLVFLAMLLIGPLIFVATWPWLWFDTVEHLRGYVMFHMKHAFYNMEYLGVNWGLPPLPISYPFVMTLFTVPTVTLALGISGIFLFASPHLRRLRGEIPPPMGARIPFDDPWRFPARRTWLRPGRGLNPKAGRLLLICTLLPMLVIALPWTPIFGGTKHWMTGYPFLALLAGVAVSRLLAHFQTVINPAGVLAALMAMLPAVPGAVNLALTHPFGLSQYNTLAGGPAGGADKGLNRQFWGYSTRQLLPWINDTFPQGANVYFHDTNHDTYNMYQRDGLLRRDIRYAGMEKPAIEASDHALVIHELHFNKYDYWIWEAYGTSAPARVLALDGVPLVTVYRRPDVATTGNRP